GTMAGRVMIGGVADVVVPGVVVGVGGGSTGLTGVVGVTTAGALGTSRGAGMASAPATTAATTTPPAGPSAPPFDLPVLVEPELCRGGRGPAAPGPGVICRGRA